jgi:hypothetical protein
MHTYSCEICCLRLDLDLQPCTATTMITQNYTHGMPGMPCVDPGAVLTISLLQEALDRKEKLEEGMVASCAQLTHMLEEGRMQSRAAYATARELFQPYLERHRRHVLTCMHAAVDGSFDIVAICILGLVGPPGGTIADPQWRHLQSSFGMQCCDVVCLLFQYR